MIQGFNPDDLTSMKMISCLLHFMEAKHILAFVKLYNLRYAKWWHLNNFLWQVLKFHLFIIQILQEISLMFQNQRF